MPAFPWMASAMRAAGRPEGSGLRAHIVKQKQVEHERFVEELDAQLREYEENH